MPSILEYIISYGSLEASFLFFTTSTIFLFNGLGIKQAKIISIISVVLCTIISFEFYLYQISFFPINILIPISIVVILLDYFKNRMSKSVLKIVFILNIIYLVFGLGLLATSNNTWGNTSAVLGMFIVPNTLLAILYLSFCVKNQKLLYISMLCAGVLSFLLIALTTNGFQYEMYDGDFVKTNRFISILISFFLVGNGILQYVKRKKH